MSERVHFSSEERFRAAVERLWTEQHARLRELLPHADVQHVGSTAVPGSLTKGDLDIQVRVPASRFAESEATLALHYPRNLKSTHTTEFAAFEDPSKDPPLGVQLTAIGGTLDIFWALREILLRRSDLRTEYDELKRVYEGRDMKAYRAAKQKFFSRVRRLRDYREIRSLGPGPASGPERWTRG
jgi:GrpB-like predicted nucleotidyltransferase (UPF0157 family)